MASTITLSRDMLNPDNPYAYYERGGHARAVALVRERFPDDMYASIVGSLAIDDIMFPTKDRADRAKSLPEGLPDEQLEDWLLEQAIDAVERSKEWHG